MDGTALETMSHQINQNEKKKKKKKRKEKKERKKKWQTAGSNPGVPSYNTHNTRAPLSIRPRRCAYEIYDFYYYC